MSTQPLKIEVIGPNPVKELMPLNDREKRALMGVLAGMGNPQIAKHLGYSPHYVKNILRQAYAKLGIHTVRELFPLVIAGGMELRTGSNATQ